MRDERTRVSERERRERREGGKDRGTNKYQGKVLQDNAERRETYGRINTLTGRGGEVEERVQNWRKLATWPGLVVGVVGVVGPVWSGLVVREVVVREGAA
jgi:hypothetical protein